MSRSIACIDYRDGKIFIAKRAQKGDMGGKWEFPGGKIEDGEDFETAIKREMLEEFGVDVKVHEKITEGTFFHKGKKCSLFVFFTEFSEDGIKVEGKKEVRVTNVDGRQIATFTAKGKYLISGECSNGQIIVHADNDKDVRLCLNGLKLTCPDSAVIYGKQCDKLLITLVGGTENVLESTKDYIYEDEEKKNPDAVVFTKDDLVINGNGTLNIKTKSAEGIHSTDSVKIISGNINIESGDRAIRGKEFVIIKEADINIKTESDAIRTTIDDDAQLGYVVIEGGNIKIETDSEGIQATGNVQITGGSLDINADGKKANAIKSDRIVFIENATVKVNSNKDIKAVSGVIADEGTIVVRG